jgi:hypothetical protein
MHELFKNIYCLVNFCAMLTLLCAQHCTLNSFGIGTYTFETLIFWPNSVVEE